MSVIDFVMTTLNINDGFFLDAPIYVNKNINIQTSTFILCHIPQEPKQKISRQAFAVKLW